MDVFSSGFLGTRLPNANCLFLGILGIGILIVRTAEAVKLAMHTADDTWLVFIFFIISNRIELIFVA